MGPHSGYVSSNHQNIFSHHCWSNPTRLQEVFTLHHARSSCMDWLALHARLFAGRDSLGAKKHSHYCIGFDISNNHSCSHSPLCGDQQDEAKDEKEYLTSLCFASPKYRT